LAFTLLFVCGAVFQASRKLELDPSQRKSINFLLVAVAVQFLLGVFTVLYQAPVSLSSIHQIGAFFLFMASLTVAFRSGAFRTDVR
jgi:cytochrome c oxidase assembly protein subunit 15